MRSPHPPKRRGTALAAGACMSLAVLAQAVPASAAVPGNDDPADAVMLTAPQEVSGTLVGATISPDEEQYCGPSTASVWYRFRTPTKNRIVAVLDAAGEMDASITLYRKVRSRLTFADCEQTDKSGRAVLEDTGLDADADYLIRVANLKGSKPAGFDLRLAVPNPPPEPPGRRLPAGGISNRVDRITNVGDAWWRKLAEGRTMRVYLGSQKCVSLSIYGPGTTSFDDADPLKHRRCGGYLLFTAEQTGRYFFVVEAQARDAVQRYRLRVKPARPDDTAPGIFIRNHAKVVGRLNGGIDSRDLYRFDVTRRSELTLSTSGDTTVRLMNDHGGWIDEDTDVMTRLRPGRYFASVTGTGRYTLKRVSRTITKSSLTFNGHGKAVSAPGRTARLQLRVRPAVSGPATINVDRLDPVDGWQHVRLYRVSVSNGRALVQFQPASVGTYRASAEYLGTRDSAASASGTSRLRVRGPLAD